MIDNPTGAGPDVAFSFLSETLPFSELDRDDLMRLARQCVIDFVPKGVKICEQGKTKPDTLFIIQKGGVKLYKQEDGKESLVDFRGEGDSIGGAALAGGGLALFDVETIEDTFFFRIPKAPFLELIKTNPGIAGYYLDGLPGDYMSKAFSEMRVREVTVAAQGGLHLFGETVGAASGGEAISVPMGTTIQGAAGVMNRQGIGSILVTDPSGDVLGIVTDKDLRKIVSVGMDYAAPVEIIMSSPVITVDHNTLCFDALLRMMTHRIHHLAVTRDGKIDGVVTSHDLMVLQGRSPMSLFREISSQHTIPGLYPLAKRIPEVVHSLVEEGAKAVNIARMITVLNDHILERVLSLLLLELGTPPAKFCWLLMGSEGRREQTLHTDQDNALIIQDVDDEIWARACDIYFAAFTERAIKHLVECGFPPCPGDNMASNAAWRMHYTAWRGHFDDWIAVPNPQEVLNSAIFFDFRSGYGHAPYAEQLRRHLKRACPRNEIFLHYLAANCLETRPPLSFFRSFIVEKNGEHKNTLNIKERGLVPIVDFARVLSLKYGVISTNTTARLDKLAEKGVLREDLHIDISDTYEFMMQLRLVHQLEQTEDGQEPDNHINPKSLSELEKRTLKEAFAVIGRMQSFLRDEFRVEG